MIEIDCSKCRNENSVPFTEMGNKIQCGNCGTQLTVPERDELPLMYETNFTGIGLAVFVAGVFLTVFSPIFGFIAGHRSGVPLHGWVTFGTVLLVGILISGFAEIIRSVKLAERRLGNLQEIALLSMPDPVGSRDDAKGE